MSFRTSGSEIVTLKKDGLDYSVYIQHTQQWSSDYDTLNS